MLTGIRAWISDRTSGFASAIKRRLGVVLVLLGIAMLVIAVVFLKLHGTDKALAPDAAIDSLGNLSLVIAAIVGLPLAIWRTAVAKQQANASDRQTETAERRLKNELYEKGAEMLGNDVTSVRLGGIYRLKGLAKENPGDYLDQVFELLCAFVRDPPDEKARELRAGAKNWQNPGASTVKGILRDDVQTAMNIIARRWQEPEVQCNWEGFRPLDLRGARLECLEAEACDFTGAILHGAILDGANLTDASLRDAKMSDGSMRNVRVAQANFSGASLWNVDMRQISASGADFSQCSLNGVELGCASAIRAKFSNSQISGSNFGNAVLQMAKLDYCHLTNTDFSGASLWRADLSGTKFGECKRVTASAAGSTSEKLFCKLTQAQLDEALAHPANPPTFDPAMLDTKTGKPLTWRGGCISEEQFYLSHAPQQIVKDGGVERNQGHYFEWRDMDVRFVPGIVENMKGRQLSRKWQLASEALEDTQIAGCMRITFVGKNGSEVDSCGVTRWNGGSLIWVLLDYEPSGTWPPRPDSTPGIFQCNGPDSKDGWALLRDAIDWVVDPVVERWPDRNGPVRTKGLKTARFLLRFTTTLG